MIRLQDNTKTTEEMMGQPEDGMGRCVWLSGWSRMSRKGYSIPQLEAIIAGSYVVVQVMAAALIWAAKNPTEEVFKQAAKLAIANELDKLWEAYYSTKSRAGFVAVVLAIAHYDLLATLNSGEYFPWIEISSNGKTYWREYPNRKHV
ncbi:hypothetical protein [Nostoc sp.]|uniref:hypothetical protein n=1 Tax=Nostoc sp. TaxID=1180 RepID=UPI002FF9CE71